MLEASSGHNDSADVEYTCVAEATVNSDTDHAIDAFSTYEENCAEKISENGYTANGNR
jgi:hypothetical protein